VEWVGLVIFSARFWSKLEDNVVRNEALDTDAIS